MSVLFGSGITPSLHSYSFVRMGLGSPKNIRKSIGRVRGFLEQFQFDRLLLHHFDTPQKINIGPENDGLENIVPLPGVYSQVTC